MLIRQATLQDALAITEIWNPVIKNTVTTFTSIEKTVHDLEILISERTELNHGFYVAVVDKTVIGFATYGPFRSGPGYAHTMEHSIFLTKPTQRKGVGKALMESLENHAQNMEVRSLIAGLAAENLIGIKFHQTLGYTKAANIKQAGYKFDRWHDLVLMQKLL
jgi:phosphinothricin acetyltransferase